MADFDSQYVIDIAAQVSGAGASSAEIDQLAAKLSGSGIKSAAFEDALTGLSEELARAQKATRAANTALGKGRERHSALEKAAVAAAKAEDRLAARAAGLAKAQAAVAAAGKALDVAAEAGASDVALAKLHKRLRDSVRELRAVQAAASGLGAAKAEAAAASAAVRSYKVELEGLEDAARDAAKSQESVAQKMSDTRRIARRVNDTLGDATTNMATFRGALGDIGGPLGELGERMLFPAQALVDLNERFGKSVATATVAGFGLAAAAAVAVTAVAALTAALAAGAVALVGYAVAASDAARELDIAREAAARMAPELRGIPWDEIMSGSTVAEDRLRSLASSFTDAGVSAKDLPAALRAAAAAETALGTGGADKFVDAIRSGKMSVDEFASTVDSKLGDLVARRMLGLEAQGARFQRSVRDLFGDFDVEPALMGLSTLVGLFAKNSAAGRFLKTVLTGVLQPIIDQAQTAAWVVEAFVLGTLIGMTKLYIAIKPTVDKIAEVLGIDASGFTLDSVLDAAAFAGETLAPVMAAVAIAVGVAVTAFLTAIGVIGTFVTLVTGAPYFLTVLAVKGAQAIGEFATAVGESIGMAVTAVYEAVAGFVSAGAQLVDGLTGGALTAAAEAVATFVQLGSDLIVGLVSGITASAGAVVSAITGVAQGAINTAKSVLGIASPSKVFAELGANTGEGFTGGVESETTAAQSAMRDLTDPSGATPAGELVDGLTASVRGAAPALSEAVSGALDGAADGAGMALPDVRPGKALAEAEADAPVPASPLQTYLSGGAPDGGAGPAAAPAASRPAGGATSTQTSVTTSNTTNQSSSSVVIQNVTFPGGADAVEAFKSWLEGVALQGAGA